MTKQNIHWHSVQFNGLTTDQLYEILKLRVDIFVVEQNCPYPELDEKDRDSGSRHLLGVDSYGDLKAYARVLAPGVSYKESSIGRVAVAKTARGKGIAQQLMEEAITLAQKEWPKDKIKIGAQQYLKGFYQGLGFEVASDVYLEDGIPHLDMILN